MLRANYNPNPTGKDLGKYNEEFLVVNGKTFPMVKADSGKQTVATMVSDARNAQGVFIGQKIGRDQSKVEYVASVLTAKEWSEILMIFERSFVNNVTYFDMVTGRKVTRKMYVSDRTASPLSVDEEGNVTTWKDCALNLIDTGM